MSWPRTSSLVAVANGSWKVIERKRLTRFQFERFWQTQERCTLVMDACSSAHHRARELIAQGFTVRLLPAHEVRPFRTRSKTDRIDCDALLEAARSPRIKDVAVKSRDQQAILALHRAWEQWKDTRTMRINGMRGLLREFFALRAQCPRGFGITAPKGAKKFLARLPPLLEHHREQLPERVRCVVLTFWSEVQELEERMRAVEKELEGLATENEVIRTLLEIPGIGVLTATALDASVGNIHHFKDGRKLASWLGMVPKEHSSGSKRRLGRISKPGDPYLRTLLIHGARSALTAAQVRQRSGGRLTHLQQWALKKDRELHHSNQAAVALANKLARICWAVWKHERRFDGNYRPQLPAMQASAA